jgi:hypothetical protein
VNTDSIDNFEGVSLRWARAVLIGSIALGCLAMVGGLLVAGGAWLFPGPKEPTSPPTQEPAKFSLKVADKWSMGHASDLREIERAALSMESPGQIPPSLVALFPSPPYATGDVWENYCKETSDYGCLQKGRRLATASAARTFSVLLKDVDDSRRNQLIQLLAEQLPNVTLDKRLGMVAPILLSYVELETQNQEALATYDKKRKEAADSFSVDVAAHKEGQMAFSMGGLWAALWGFGGVISASVFVALLAIERHLRALRSRSGA